MKFIGRKAFLKASGARIRDSLYKSLIRFVGRRIFLRASGARIGDPLRVP